MAHKVVEVVEMATDEAEEQRAATLRERGHGAAIEAGHRLRVTRPSGHRTRLARDRLS
jgi:hypothetical protein